jgi:hypothetical protein
MVYGELWRYSISTDAKGWIIILLCKIMMGKESKFSYICNKLLYNNNSIRYGFSLMINNMPDILK